MRMLVAASYGVDMQVSETITHVLVHVDMYV